jgi:thioredoxin reductase
MSAYDVIVAGGGAAGVGAAVGAARAGAHTLLIERGSFLGGAATLRSVTTYCGLYLSGSEETDTPGHRQLGGLVRRYEHV